MAYWARLRRDRPSSWAAGLAFVAVLMAALSIMGLAIGGAQAESRADPLYWAVLLPVAWSGAELASFEPRPVRHLAAVTVAAPLVAAAPAAVALAQGRDATLWLIATALAIAAAVGSRLAWRRSLLRLEGPSR